MINFKLNGIGYSAPSNLNDCTAEQIGHIFSAQIALNINKIERQKLSIKLGLFHLLSGVPLKMLDRLTAAQLLRLLQEIAWCYKAKITVKPFEFFEFESVKYHLPKPNFGNTTAIELATSNIYYLAFTRKESPSFDAIFNIVATLCRPVRKDLQEFKNSKFWNGDEREIYNTTLADERVALFKKNLNMGIAIAIMNYFELMNNAFWKKYETLLDESEEIPMYLNGEGQITMLMEIAEMGSFGDFDNVCKQPVHTLWLFIKDKKLKVEKAEREAAYNNNNDDE